MGEHRRPRVWRSRSILFIQNPFGGVPEIGVPQNGWLIVENPIKTDDLGVPPFQETFK